MNQLLPRIQALQPLLAWLKSNPKSVTPLVLLLGLSVLRRLNQSLSYRSLNNHLQPRKWDWRKEIVLITGGSSGIGELIARKLAKNSIKVVVLDLNPPRTPFPANVHFYNANVTSSETIREVANAVRSDVGNPTVLVNNAGVGSGQTILEEEEEMIRRTFDVNCLALFILAKEFLPSMIREDHGHVLTIASMASFVTIASNVDYSCTKAGALAFHEGLTQELKYRYNAKHVRTSIVHPTWIRTPLLEPMLKRGNFPDMVLDPDTVADAVVAQILEGKSGQLFLPSSYSTASQLRGFPTWLQERIRGSKRHVLQT